MTTQRDGHVAFKCTFNDGGADSGPDGFLGYAGTCSIENIKRNIDASRVWCSSPDNLCSQWHDDGFDGPPPEFPCYESEVLTQWSFGSGVYHTGARAGQPISMEGALKGKVALLTTRLPETSEEQRIIFAAYKIAKLDAGDQSQGTTAHADKRHRLRIPREAALAPSLSYWSFKQDETKLWGTGLFRYLSDVEVSSYLHALRPFVERSPHDRDIVDHLLECCGSLPPPKPTTRLPLIDPALDQREVRIKYAPGGEGDRHRELKEYVARHPSLLGFGPGAAKTEHRFITGDRADVMITLNDGGYLVVEVEVEGADATLVGAHQALKYEALLLAQQGADTTCRAVLVAYRIPPSTREFCRAHGIHWFELTPH